MTAVHPPDNAVHSSVQRRTVRTLVGTQALGAMGITVGVATAPLLAKEVSGSEQLAGLAQTSQVFGAAVAAIWLARLMGTKGRRIGLTVGFAVGALGAGLAALAGVVASLPLLMVGAMLIGTTTSANLAGRYAATDLATADTRARALSMVVWATTFGAVIGPNLAGPGTRVAEAIGIPVLSGPFALAAIAMVLAAIFTWVFLRPDPLLLARRDSPPATSSDAGGWARVRAAVRYRPAILAAILAMASAHSVMVSVMVMTPLHMQDGGAQLRIIGLVISIHVLGMFALSPLVGLAVDRWGRSTVMIAGAAVLAASLILAGGSRPGSSPRLMVGLFLLGLGWSLVTIAAATLLTDLTSLDSRTQVQGFSDMTMSVSAAVSAAIGGVITGTWGYPVLTICAGVLVVGTLVAAWGARRH